MANYNTLITAIQSVIRTNGNNEITGDLLQQSLLTMIESLGAGYQFVGVATPTTNPETSDEKIFYIAGPGSYPNFGTAIIPDGYIGTFKYDNQWHLETINFPLGDNAVSTSKIQNQAITKAKLSTSLLAELLNNGYKYNGIAEPSTNPGTPEQDVFYLASKEGTYTNFGGIKIGSEQFAVLKYHNGWSKDIIDIYPYFFLLDYDVSDLVSCGATINNQNKWQLDSSYYGGLLNVTQYRNCVVKIKSQTSRNATYTFLKSGVVSGQTPSYATGFSSTISIAANTEISVRIPEDAVYLYVYLHSPNIDYRPQSIKFYEYLAAHIERIDAEIKELTRRMNLVFDELRIVEEQGDIPLAIPTTCGGTIVNNKWSANEEYFGGLVPILDYHGKQVAIKSKQNQTTSYTFVTAGFNSGQNVQYAVGYGAPTVIPANTEVVVTIPSDALYLYVYLQSPGVDYRPQSLNVRALITQSRLDEIEAKLQPIDNFTPINVSQLVSCGATINNQNKWYLSSEYFGSLTNVEQFRGSIFKIKSQTSRNATYTFLKSGVVSGQTPDYATGYSSTITIGPNTENTVQIPDDAVYVYIYLESSGTSYRPQSASLGETFTMWKTITNGRIAKLENARDQIVVMNYNIGHFSNGANPSSTITPTNYDEKLAEGRAVISKGNPMLYGLEEYSAVFGTSDDGPKQAENVLFPFCATKYITSQLHYACNALFANRVQIYNATVNDFECNQDEVITHTSAIEAKDYRYISADLYAFGKEIKLVITHLAFDNNRPSVLQLKQINELVTKYASYPNVLMLGDWNIAAFTDFAPFVSAGYTLANDGGIITYPSTGKALDNIIVKGLNVMDCYAEQSVFSDHYPLIAIITE